MAFDDLVGKSGKGLDVSKELVVALEVNLGGTLGTQYFADKNVTIEGTYYDGRISSTSIVNRNIFPDVRSFEISDLNVSLLNQDQNFRDPKWVRYTHGSPTRLRIALEGTRDLQQTDFITRYNGIIEGMDYDYDKDLFTLEIQDRVQNLLKTLVPPHRLEETHFPSRDDELTKIGQVLPYFYDDMTDVSNHVSAFVESAPGIIIGTHTEGTTKILFADHAVSDNFGFYQDGQGTKIINGTYIFYNQGTVTTYGTRPVAYMDLNHDPGTSVVSTRLYGGRGTASGWANFSWVARNLLESGGLTWPDDFGTFTFNRVAQEEVDGASTRMRARRHLTEQKTVKEHIDDLCLASSYIIYFDSTGKAQIKLYRYSSDEVTGYYSNGDVIEGTKELDESDFIHFEAHKDASHIFNKGEFVYSHLPYWNLYTYYDLFEHQPSMTRMGYTRTKKMESPWAYGTGLFQRCHMVNLGRFRYPIYKSKFVCPINVLPLDLGDYIKMTHTKAPNEYGTQGWQEKQMEIVKLEEDYNNMTVSGEAWEWQLGIPPYGLINWHSLADGEGTRIGYEFAETKVASWQYFYNKLVAVNATEDEIWANKINDDYVVTLDGTNQFLSPFNTCWGRTDALARGLRYAFVKPDDLDNKMSVMSSCSLGTFGWDFGIETDGSIYFSHCDFDNNWVTKTSSANTIQGPGTWQSLGAQYVGTGGEYFVEFYINGTITGTAHHFGTKLKFGTLAYDGIGASDVYDWNQDGTVTGLNYFDGQRGDVLYYNLWKIGTYSMDKIQDIHNGLRGRYGL